MEIAFKHMSPSEAAQEHAENTFQNILDKFTLNYTSVRVVLSVNKKFFSVHISLHLGDGFQLELEENAKDMHVAIDKIADILGRQLRKHKERLRHHKGEDSHEVITGIIND